MINYLTHPNFIEYDPVILPSRQRGAGGMAVKTYRVGASLKPVYPKVEVISNAGEISADTVLIEPLRFALGVQKDGLYHEHVDVVLEKLAAHEGQKILYCSEKTLLKMSRKLQERVLAVCTAVTANCLFQKRLILSEGIDVLDILCDPVPLPVGVKPFKDRRNAVVACGQVSWQKNAMEIINVFEGLDGIIERVYVGSSKFWNSRSKSQVGMELEDKLRSVTDTFITELTPVQLLDEFNDCRFGLWCAYHDTFATSVHEMLMNGVIVVAGGHGLSKDIPVMTGAGVGASVKVDMIKDLMERDIEELTGYSNRVSDWAQQTVSYPVFLNQFQGVLQKLWR